MLLVGAGAAMLLFLRGYLAGGEIERIQPDLLSWFTRLGALTVLAGGLIALAARFVLGTERGIRVDAWRARVTASLDPGRASLLTWIAALLWAICFGAQSILRHQLLNSAGYDLAIEDQLLWNLAHGHGFASSIEVPNYLGDHFVPSYALLAPLYWIWDDVRILLAAQSGWLALGAPAMFRIALRRSSDPLVALVFGLTYLFLPAVGFMSRFDAHWVTAALPVLLWAIAMWEEERRLPWAVLLLFSLTLREEVGLASGLLALLAWRRKGWRALGLCLAVMSFAWAVLAVFAWIPHFRSGLESDTLGRYAYLGSTPGEIVLTLLRRPWLPFVRELSQLRRLVYLFQLVLPSGFLSLLAPDALLAGSLVFLQNFWSDDLNQCAIYFHYQAPVLPFLCWASVVGGLRALNARWFASAGGTTLVLSWITLAPVGAGLLDSPILHSARWPYTECYGLERDHDVAAFRRAAALIPKDASVLAAETLAAQFAHRTRVQVYHSSWAWLLRGQVERQVPGVLGPWDADWIVLDLTSRRHQEYPERVRVDADVWLEGGYRVAYYDREFLLLTRSAAGDSDAAARWSLDRTAHPRTETDSTLPDKPGTLPR